VSKTIVSKADMPHRRVGLELSSRAKPLRDGYPISVWESEPRKRADPARNFSRISPRVCRPQA
jgi:hypothetical protein